MVYERGQNIRHIFMDVPHSANPAPSWLGESVGHYEGNTLVIDTIAINNANVGSPVPEPSSIAALLGLSLFLIRRR